MNYLTRRQRIAGIASYYLGLRVAWWEPIWLTKWRMERAVRRMGQSVLTRAAP